MAGGGRPRDRRRVGALVVLVTLAGALAACSDDDQGTPPPSSTSTAPTSSAPPSPIPTPPTAPATKPTPESAEAFARYFWDVYNYAYQTLDAEPLTSISARACTFCRSTNHEVEALKAARKRVSGGKIRVKTIAAPPGDLTKGVIVTMVLDQEPGKTLNDDGTLSSTFPAVRNMRSEVALRWQSKWSVYGVANDEKTGTR